VAALIADYWILPPTGQFMGKDISDIVSLGGFAFMGVFMSVVAGLYRASRDKAAKQERKVLEEVVEKERDFSSAVAGNCRRPRRCARPARTNCAFQPGLRAIDRLLL